MEFSLHNPLVLLALAMAANAVATAGVFVLVLRLGGRIVSLYQKIAAMDEDNIVDSDEISAGITGVKEIVDDYRAGKL